MNPFCSNALRRRDKAPLSFWLIIALIACSSAARGDEPANNRVKEIVALMRKMPQWPFRPGARDADDEARAKADAQKVEEAAAAIAKYNLDEIQAAIKQLSSPYDAATRAKLFILNQYLFEIPEGAKVGSIEDELIRHAYRAFPMSAMTSKSWPWITEKGLVRFSIEAEGYMFMGPPYDAVEKFGQFRKHFRQRSVKSDKKDK